MLKIFEKNVKKNIQWLYVVFCILNKNKKQNKVVFSYPGKTTKMGGDSVYILLSNSISYLKLLLNEV